MTIKTFDPGFTPTKANSRFVEFIESCLTYRYIGVCYGSPGVGKTFSAREFAQYEAIKGYHHTHTVDDTYRQQLGTCRAVFYTASVANSPTRLDHSLLSAIRTFGQVRMRLDEIGTQDDIILQPASHCPLLIIDEADRLTFKSLEHVRDLYDRYGFGLVLMGMPGLEKRLARYPQLYSRIGFLHEFCPLSPLEMRFVFEKYWQMLDSPFDPEVFDDVEAMNLMTQITRGNFRLIHRLFGQVQRIMLINDLEKISAEVVETARECLIIGPVN